MMVSNLVMGIWRHSGQYIGVWGHIEQSIEGMGTYWAAYKGYRGIFGSSYEDMRALGIP